MGYLLQHRIGRGGMGVVDLALDPSGRPVALKRLAITGTVEELARARARLRREVETLRSLHHPAIVPLLDVLDDGDDLVLVMPYLEGGSLSEKIGNDGPLAPRDVSRVARQLLPAMAVMHRRGVIHRDCKPANVLFDAAGSAYLTDFGVAALRDATGGLTATGSVVGTPAFIAPEQARGDDPGTAADVFSLGATLYFAATGEGVYGAADAATMMRRAAAGSVRADLSRVDPSLARPLAAMLHPDPRQRPTAAQLAGGPQGTQPAIARPPAPPGPAPSVGPPAGPRPGAVEVTGSNSPSRRPPTDRGRLRPVVAAAVAVAVIGGGGTALALSSRTIEPAAASTAVRSDLGPTTSTTCPDLPYWPCHGEKAPGTDGHRCTDDRFDLDEDVENGCEAEPDALDGSDLVAVLEPNLIPDVDTDAFDFAVADLFSLTCDGEVTLTLQAPAGTSMVLTVRSGRDTIDDAVSKDGKVAKVRLREPECGGDDSAVYTASVSYAEGSKVSAKPYTLTRSGDF